MKREINFIWRPNELRRGKARPFLEYNKWSHFDVIHRSRGTVCRARRIDKYKDVLAKNEATKQSSGFMNDAKTLLDCFASLAQGMISKSAL
jgi:hypothetical protein